MGAVEGLIISVITQQCRLIPGLADIQTGDVVSVLHETIGDLRNIKQSLLPAAFGNCVCSAINGDWRVCGVCV